jgi:flavorubredoxin
MEIIKPPLLAKYTPDSKALEECRELGKKVAQKIMEGKTG